jgi:large subunit ribosomal protein L5
MSRLKKRYHEQIRPDLQSKFNYSNAMQVPTLKKVVISMGLAEAIKDKNALQDCMKELALLSGQKPLVTKSKKSIANFKLREGQAIGLKVTLRGIRMWEFIDRFCNIVAPRIRDFRGFPKKTDGRGNYSLGLEEQQIFPEINPDEIKRTQGMNVTLVTTARTEEESLEFLTMLGFVFKTAQG